MAFRVEPSAAERLRAAPEPGDLPAAHAAFREYAHDPRFVYRSDVDELELELALALARETVSGSHPDPAVECRALDLDPRYVAVADRLESLDGP